MDQKLFLEKLTEVADWEWERVQGAAGSKGRSEAIYADYPERIKLNGFKNNACPYQEGKENCNFKIYKRLYGKDPVKIQKCETCGALLTPKGNFIAKPESHQYPALIIKADREN
jgi:hypothetical protein